MTVPGGAQIEAPEGWSPDHLLLAALVRCSIDSFAYHARRAGHEVDAAGSAHGRSRSASRTAATHSSRSTWSIDAALDPRSDDPAELVAKAERDCFVGASLTVEPDYDVARRRDDRSTRVVRARFTALNGRSPSSTARRHAGARTR